MNLLRAELPRKRWAGQSRPVGQKNKRYNLPCALSPRSEKAFPFQIMGWEWGSQVRVEAPNLIRKTEADWASPGSS